MTALSSQSHMPDMNRTVGDFVSERIWGEPGRFKDFCSMAVLDDKGQLIAGLIYHNFTPEFRCIEMSAGSVSRRWMTRQVLRDIINMPFKSLECDTIIARHDETATHLRRMWTNIGAVEYVIPHVRGKGKPAEVVSVLTDEAWFGSKY